MFFDALHGRMAQLAEEKEEEEYMFKGGVPPLNMPQEQKKEEF